MDLRKIDCLSEHRRVYDINTKSELLERNVCIMRMQLNLIYI